MELILSSYSNWTPRFEAPRPSTCTKTDANPVEWFPTVQFISVLIMEVTAQPV